MGARPFHRRSETWLGETSMTDRVDNDTALEEVLKFLADPPAPGTPEDARFARAAAAAAAAASIVDDPVDEDDPVPKAELALDDDLRRKLEAAARHLSSNPFGEHIRGDRPDPGHGPGQILGRQTRPESGSYPGCRPRDGRGLVGVGDPCPARPRGSVVSRCLAAILGTFAGGGSRRERRPSPRSLRRTPSPWTDEILQRTPGVACGKSGAEAPARRAGRIHGPAG